MEHFDFQGKTVVITGASMGIGESFARALAAQGAKLVLVARSQDKLQRLRHELGSEHLVVVEDLTQTGAARRVFDALSRAGLAPDVLINNAGFGLHGAFTEQPLATHRDMLDLNVTALVELTYLFLPMLERRRGGVINVASTAAFQPVPYMAVYAASKAFVLSFSEALWGEYRPRGVRVLALCPGATDTPFFARAGEAAALGKKARVEDVVTLGLRAFQSGRASVVHGAANFLTSLSSRFFSRALTVRVSERLMRPSPLRLGAGNT